VTHDMTRIDGRDIAALLAPGGERRQRMRGFSDEFVDIVHYIVLITHQIWEEKQVNLIYDYYSHNCPVHTARGLTYGREAVIASTLQSLHAFPDRRVFAEDVVWGGDDEQGFYSSHRIASAGRNTGYSAYGPPTGKKVHVQVVADCLVKENRIIEEWLVRDELTAVRQLGLDPRAVAREVARSLPQAFFEDVEGAVERTRGQGLPEPQLASPAADPMALVQQTLHEVWNWRALGRIAERFAPNYQCHAPSGRELYGQGAYLQYVLSLLAAFPDAQLTVDHVCAVTAAGETRVAVRWTLLGTHQGHGIYGPPTGRPVRLLGVSHFGVRDGLLQEEWTVFDEIALLAQVIA